MEQNTQDTIVEDVVAKYNLRLLILFGSRVKGGLHSESDYDVAYLSKDTLSLEDEGGLILDLMEIIRVTDERLINLVNIRTAGPLLLKEIFDTHEVIFREDGDIYDTYKIYATKYYLDSRPLFELREYLIANYLSKHA
jgi:uncharacterized protein